MYALEGIRVLDLTRTTPGPYCTMLLGDMGADILRIEEPAPPTAGRRAAGRAGAPRTPEEEERALAANAITRNKRSIGLNLRDERARAIFYKLCETADVVIEGFRPGVVKRLGVDYEAVSKINPRIVYCSLTGYGQYGPYSQLAGHDINYIAQSGLLSIIGDNPETRPSIPLNLMADFAGGGAQAAFGILCALLARERTGRGQQVDVAMADGGTQLICNPISSYYESGKVTPRGRSTLSGTKVHYNAYECRDGRWISIGSLEPYFYENFCKVIGREAWLDKEYADDDVHAQLIQEAQQIFLTRGRDEWFDLLNQTDLCAMKILDLDELEHDPHIQAREMIITVDHPKLGAVQQVGFAPKLSDTPAGFRRFAPRLGENTDEVLHRLGLGQDEIGELRSAGVVK